MIERDGEGVGIEPAIAKLGAGALVAVKEARKFPYVDASTRADATLAILELSLLPSLNGLPRLEHNDGSLLKYCTP